MSPSIPFCSRAAIDGGVLDSARTRWLDYPPFHLANAYRFEWRAAIPFGRFLLVAVQRQQR